MSRRSLLAALGLLVAAMLAVGWHPFAFGSRNGARWLRPGPGLIFDGPAIAYTRTPLGAAGAAAPDALSVELWIEEPPGTPNWGRRKILSISDGARRPLLAVGGGGGSVFLYLRGERARAPGWAGQLRTTGGFARDRPVFVAAVYGRGQQALYLDGARAAGRAAEPRADAPARLAGRLVLGSESNGVRSWLGVLRGLAVYGRALGAREVAAHGRRARERGPGALRGEPGLLALYVLDEGRGERARSLVPGSPALRVPRHFAPYASAALRGWDARGGRPRAADAALNLAGFAPLGLLWGLLAAGGGARRRWAVLAAGVAFGAALGLAIEVGQNYLPSRTSSVEDWLWNSAGTALGLLLARGGRVLGPRAAR